MSRGRGVALGLVLALAGFGVVGCNGALGDPGLRPVDSGPLPVGRDGGGPPPEPSLADIEAEEATAYLALIAPVMIGRTLSASETAAVEARGGAAIAEVLEGWNDEPGLSRAARRMVETALAVSGGVVESTGIDFGAPGRIVESVVREERPWSEILTTDRCVDEAGAAVDCDTGAPYAAGVITTRAFMAARQGRFNLTRAGTITRSFLCRNYPIEIELEPPIERERLMPMFRALTREEQTDPEAAMSGAVNGFHCYACHGQFGAHAQLFVRFDMNGMWREDATGLQHEGGMPGESFGGLMASHLEPEFAADESSQMVGQEVANLSEAMQALTETDAFWSCASQRVIELALDLDPSRGIEDALLESIADAARARSASPTFQDLVVAALAHPRVAIAAARQLDLEPADEEVTP